MNSARGNDRILWHERRDGDDNDDDVDDDGDDNDDDDDDDAETEENIVESEENAVISPDRDDILNVGPGRPRREPAAGEGG